MTMLAIRARRAPIVTDRKAPTAQLGLSVSRATYNRLDEIAWDRRITKGELIREIVLRWIEEHDRGPVG
jgi:hypothetical protein